MSFTIDHGPALTLETKAISECDDAWVVSGWASVFGNKDLTGDIVMPGAFQKSLRDHGMPILLWNHKHDDAPLGCVVECEERKKGLFFRAEMPKDDTFVSGRIIPQLKRRGLRGVSIGYKATEREQRKDARLLKQIRLYEISICSTPANPLAEIETVKSLSPEEMAELAVFGSVFGNFTEELQMLAIASREMGAAGFIVLGASRLFPKRLARTRSGCRRTPDIRRRERSALQPPCLGRPLSHRAKTTGETTWQERSQPRQGRAGGRPSAILRRSQAFAQDNSVTLAQWAYGSGVEQALNKPPGHEDRANIPPPLTARGPRSHPSAQPA